MTPHDRPAGPQKPDPARSSPKPKPAPGSTGSGRKPPPTAVNPAAPGGVEQPKNDRRKRGDLQKRDL